MRLKFLSIFLLLMICLWVPTKIHAQTVQAGSEVKMASEEAQPLSEDTSAAGAAAPTNKIEYSRGTVTKILEENEVVIDGQKFYTQKLQIRRDDDSNQEITVDAGSEFQPLNATQKLSVGKQVILGRQDPSTGASEWVIADVFRLPMMIWLAIGFFGLVILIAHKQGATSIVGMLISLAVLVGFMIPHILAGQSPVLISLIGCGVVATVTMYLSHGFSRHTHIALASVLISLGAVSILAWIAVHLGQLSGLGTEEATYLQFGPTAKINLQGLLLGGIMLGALGVLDDICIAQVSIVDQLEQAKPHITFKELYERAMAVGKDHVASLVNTLVLAYVGSSFPLFLLFSINKFQPMWVTLNSEVIAQEVIRTLTGSIGLVLAVPLTTLTAAYITMSKWGGERPKRSPRTAHSHSH